jgi:PIN domain nuclease of toxin-antitoxin system
MANAVVLDAQPLVALVAAEPIAPKVIERLRAHLLNGDALICAVNWCEVLYLAKRCAGIDAAARMAGLLQLVPVRVVDVDASMAGRAALIKADHGLGLGDSFAAALSLTTGFPLLTRDADFLPLSRDGLVIDRLE